MSIFNKDNNLNNEGKIIEGEIIETNSLENQYIKNQTYPYKKNRKRTGLSKRILSYVLVGLISASLGGTVSSILTIKYFNKAASQQQQSIQKENNVNTVNKTSANTVPLSVANVAKQVGPAVVGVSTKSISSNDIFGFPEQQEGMGSGIIFNEEGYILTNYHVVAGAKQINVIFNTGDGGKEIPAKLINYNAEMDIAVIKTTEKVTVPAVAEFGDSDSLQIGDPAIAIGNPLGKEFLGTVTSGVVSAVNREIAIDGQKHTYIQTDAAINPGNSGGALVNVYGQVIGVNSAKIGGNQVEGMGFAIPINAIKPEIEHLLKPILKIGIGAREIDSKLSKEYNIPIGIYIQQIEEFSPAERAGLMPGDVITKFDGKTVKTIKELNELKQKHNVNDTINIEIVREGNKKTLTLKLTEN